MSIANRILLGFSLLILLMAGLGSYGLRQLGVVRNTMETVVGRDVAMIRQLNEVRADRVAMRDARNTALTQFLVRALGRPVTGADPLLAHSRAFERTSASLAEASANVTRFGDQAVNEARSRAWQRVGQALGQATALLQQLQAQTDAQFEAIRNNDIDGAFAAGRTLTPVAAELDQALNRADSALDEALDAGQRGIAEIYGESRVSVLAVLGVAVLLGFGLALLVRLTVVSPLATFMEFVGRVGRGDLSGSAAGEGRDEIGRLGSTLNGMVEGLRQLATQSREVTNNLNAAAAEIRASTQEQAASVEEQLAAVQETAATMDEITHAGAQIGKRAQEVIAAAQATAQTSTAGLRAVDDTGQAMDAIREQAEAVAGNIVALSEKTAAISEIIATVNDISERSHLLALNAAIEAAAAGENGRSFAVVAAEMKTLADQAKDATAQVRSILGDIQRGINSSVMLTEEAVKRVAAGKTRTDTTQGTIQEITGRIQESVQTFQQIVASTNQQQLGIEQVMVALQNIRTASQQTASGTRQLDSAAANLSDLSQQLVTLADRYRT
ncbi:methyl-accepting chemotaxis protein [Roseomonas sp. BN140053]|uniref:methyl-accepting chemotaxis protein n=1 Tax=Roseomonas sp. BN140053 TaxID=3391898 RepID=UPI0039E8913B